MPIALNSLMVGDWKSLLLNFGGTGPDPAVGGSAEAVVLLVDAAMLEKVDCVTGSTDTEGELKPGEVQEGSPVARALEDETATVGVDETEASDCACLAASCSRQLWYANRTNTAWACPRRV